jgi:hypothetical protein
VQQQSTTFAVPELGSAQTEDNEEKTKRQRNSDLSKEIAT